MEEKNESSVLENSPLPTEASEKSEKIKCRNDRNFAIAVASILILISGIFVVVDLKTLELGSDMRILGPGAVPLFVFGILILLNIWYLIEVITGRGTSAKSDCHVEMYKVKKALRLYVLIVFCLFLMSFIGFVLAMMIFTFVEMKFLSEKKVTLRTIVISTFLVPLFIYFIFGFLNVPLPQPTWMPF